jgi:hypothetical protein
VAVRGALGRRHDQRAEALDRIEQRPVEGLRVTDPDRAGMRRAAPTGGVVGGIGSKAHSRLKVFVSGGGGGGGKGKGRHGPEHGNMFAFCEQAVNRYEELRRCVCRQSHKKLVYCGTSLQRAKNGIMHSDV